MTLIYVDENLSGFLEQILEWTKTIILWFANSTGLLPTYVWIKIWVHFVAESL